MYPFSYETIININKLMFEFRHLVLFDMKNNMYSIIKKKLKV